MLKRLKSLQNITDEELAKIVKKFYIDEKMHVREIAAQLQIKKDYVYLILRKNNIKRTKDQITEIKRRTFIEKYKVDAPLKIKDVSEKRLRTLNEKYNNKFLSDDNNEEIKKLFIDENQTAQEIARNLNLTPPYVRRRIKAMGLVKTPEQLAAKKEEIIRRRAKQLCVNKGFDYLSEELLRKLYLDENLSIQEIADKYGKTPTVVWTKIKKYKLEKSEDQLKDFNEKKNKERVGTFKQNNDGALNIKQLHIPKNIREIINSEENFSQLVKKMNTNTKSIADKLGIDIAVVINRCHKWNLWKYIKRLNCLSYEENELRDFIKSFYHGPIETPNKTILGGKHIDIYLPQKKMGIEYNGSYWHRIDSKSTKPKQKTKIAIEKGIRLIHIYDYEWHNYKDNVKQFLYWLIHKKGRKFYNINNLTIKEIDKKDYYDFLEHNHLFGKETHSVIKMYGLFTDTGEMISVSGFGKSFRKQYDWEWKRFCIKYGYVIEGGAPEKFLEEFAKDHHGVLVDYQQMDRFPTISSERMGFKKVRWNEGFVSVDTRSKTYRYTRHRFIPEDGLTSLETMQKYGYDVEVPNAGTITWIKEI